MPLARDREIHVMAAVMAAAAITALIGPQAGLQEETGMAEAGAEDATLA
jgi:hypothetical protein